MAFISFRIAAAFCVMVSLLPGSMIFGQSMAKVQTFSPVQQKPCPCTVSQGSFTADLEFMTGPQTPVGFYNYIGSSASTGLELSNTALFFLYEGGGESAFITILDKVNDGSGGSSVINYSCFPPGSFVALADDGGELFGSPPSFTGNFNWGTCCTDGGVISGVGCGNSFVIDPSFPSGINTISFVSGTQSAPDYLTLPSLACPIIINCGGTICCDNAIEVTATVQNANCSNSQNGSIQLNTECTSAPTFEWSNGGTMNNISGLSPGPYTVTITDAGGCTAIETYNVGVSSNDPTPSITGPVIFCEGSNVNLGVNGSFSTYQWSTGDVTSSITISEPGTYTLTVTNAAGCSGTAETTVGQHPAPQVIIDGPTELCEDAVIFLDAGSGFTSYFWSTGVQTQSTLVADPGTYSVTIFDSNGCIGTDQVEVEGLPAPLPLIEAPDTICQGTSALLDSGPGFFSYQWSNGGTGQTLTLIEGGTYSVTVTNEFGCSGTDDHTLTVNPTDTVLLQFTSCNPLDTGIFISPYFNLYGCEGLKIETITLAPTDSVYQEYTSCNPLDTGTFTSVYTNRFGCDSISVSHVEWQPFDEVLIQAYSCVPQDTGRWVNVFMNRFGCDSIVRRIISLNPSDKIEIAKKSCNPSEAGVKEFLFKNRFGCDSLVTITTRLILSDTTVIQSSTCDETKVGVSESLLQNAEGCDSLIMTITRLVLSDTTQLQAFSCDKTKVGVREILLQNAEGCDSLVVLQTLLLPGDTTRIEAFTCDVSLAGQSINTLKNILGCDSLVIRNTLLRPADTVKIKLNTCLESITGSVTKTLTNRFGCDSIVITETQLLPPSQCTMQSIVQADSISCKEQTGSVRITLPEGMPPYNYTWSSGSGSNGQGVITQSNAVTEIKPLVPGMYQCTITDSQGLKSVSAFSIFKPSDITGTIVLTKNFNGYGVSCADASDGQIGLSNIKGGVPPYSFNWSNGSKALEQTQLRSGWYLVTVSTGLDCSFIDSIQITAPDPLQLEVGLTQPDCFSNGKGVLRSTDAEGGVKPYLYSLNQKTPTTNNEFNNLSPGKYQLELTDANGCVDKKDAEIIAYTDALIQLGRDTIIKQGASLTLSYSLITGTSKVDSIVWTGINCNNCPSINVTPENTTTYEITAIDSIGCRSQDEITITVIEDERVTAPNILSIDGNGGNGRFTVYGSKNLVNIENLSVYDRWGNKVFEARDIPPGEPQYGWDGSFGTARPVPGVYLFTCSVVFVSGKRQQFSGDVTLIR